MAAARAAEPLAARVSAVVAAVVPALVAAMLAGTLAGLLGCAASTYEQGRHALDAGRTEEAIALFDSAIGEGTSVFEARRDRGAARLAAGDVAAALEDLETAAAERRDDPRLQWLLGEAYTAAGRYADAAGAYRTYELLTDRASVRKLVRSKVAQLEQESARAAAAEVLRARAAGTPPEPNTVAVYAFRPAAGAEASLTDQKVCRALNVLVSADLAKITRLRTLAADQLDAIYAERRFTYENRQSFEAASLVAAGGLVPARHMVRGLYGSLPGERIALGAACYDAETRVSSACSELDGAAADLFDLETQLVIDVLEALGLTPTPAELEALGRKPTRNLAAFLAFADGLYLRELGDLSGAASAFQKATAIDPGFGLAADMAETVAVEAQPDVVIQVPPPPVSDTTGERATTSALQLGLGLIPAADSGDATEAATEDVVRARGETTVRIRGRIGGDQ